MKEPVLVALVIVQPWNQESQLIEIKLPLKKVNLQCTITKDRFLRFLLKLDILQEEDIDFVCFQFYDHSQQAYVPEKQVFDNENNRYSFSESFLGHPELMLKTYILYENNFSNFKQLDQTIQQFEEELEHVKQDQEQIRKEIQEQNQKFQKMREDLNSVQDLAKMNKIQKKQADVVILYSNPLISENREALFIDYESEINEIAKSIESSGKLIKYQVLQATLSNLDIALSLNPVILHLIINGELDVIGAGLYFEFQEDGIVKKLYTNQLQEIIDSNQRKLKRIKIICISSMIAHEIVPYLQVRLQGVQFVAYQKLHNTMDQLAINFWKPFYDNIFLNQPVDISFKIAMKELKFYFKKNFASETINVQICCCFHKHEKQCPYDPQKIGYEKSHSSHIKCLKQSFKHKKECDSADLDQCSSNCIGSLTHLTQNLKCVKKNNICVMFEEIHSKIITELKFLHQFDDDKIDEIRLIDLEIIGCCCEILTIYQDKLQLTKPQSNYFKQHLIDNLFSHYYLNQEECNFEEYGYSENQEFFKINTQIIVIHSKTHFLINNPVIRILFNYFEKYSQCINKKLIANDDQYSIKQAHQQIKNKKNEEFLIVILQIDEKPGFVEEIKDLQQDITQNTVVILVLSNQAKEKIIDFLCDQKLQIIDYDLVQSYNLKKN